jgi:uncharacterized membrane protein
MLQTAARVLGWISAGLGAVQIVAPRPLLRAVGLQPTFGRVVVTRLVGLRELSVVPGLLAASLPVGWLAARVAGDVMDLALLAVGHRSADGRRPRLRAATAAVIGILGVDLVTTAVARLAQRARSPQADRVIRSITVGRPAAELYAFWRDLENLPRVMPHLESVASTGATTSHWVARGPLGSRIEWDAETVTDIPNERIAWQSRADADVNHAGEVRFVPAPAGRGTEIHVDLTYRPPGGPLGRTVATLTGEQPEQQIADALRRFKQVMEAGEPIVSEATATGHKLMQRPGTPLERQEPVAVRVPEPAGLAS